MSCAHYAEDIWAAILDFYLSGGEITWYREVICRRARKWIIRSAKRYGRPVLEKFRFQKYVFPSIVKREAGVLFLFFHFEKIFRKAPLSEVQLLQISVDGSRLTEEIKLRFQIFPA